MLFLHQCDGHMWRGQTLSPQKKKKNWRSVAMKFSEVRLCKIKVQYVHGSLTLAWKKKELDDVSSRSPFGES